VAALFFGIQTFGAPAPTPLKSALFDEGLTAEQVELVMAGLLKEYSPEKARANIAWLRKQGVQNIGAVLVKFPALLGYSISQRLNVRVKWLRMQGVKNITRMIVEFPSIFGYATDQNLSLKIIWLKNVGFRGIGKMIEKFPPLLGLSLVDNLDPKLRELTSKSKWNLSLAVIENQPQLFGASMARLEQLWAFLELLGALDPRRSFSLNQLTEARRALIVQQVSAQSILDHLKAVHVLHGDRTVDDLMETHLNILSDEELVSIVQVFRNNDWSEILVPRGKLTDRAIYSIASYCHKVLK
jgi:hypothetical protein